jgi:hypothetical protein
METLMRLGFAATLCVFLFPAALARAQEQTEAQKPGFFDVQLTVNDIYSYKALSFAGDFTSIESPSGFVALGRTDAGVTVAVVIGACTVKIEVLEQFQEKAKTVFGAYPVQLAASSVYFRLSPKEYEEKFAKNALTKDPNEEALAKAKAIYDTKFLGSYHAGPKAMLPPDRTRVMDFDTDAFGQIYYEEGYWLKLRRMSPYASIYPSNFVNPKQK